VLLPAEHFTGLRLTGQPVRVLLLLQCSWHIPAVMCGQMQCNRWRSSGISILNKCFRAHAYFLFSKPKVFLLTTEILQNLSALKANGTEYFSTETAFVRNSHIISTFLFLTSEKHVDLSMNGLVVTFIPTNSYSCSGG